MPMGWQILHDLEQKGQMSYHNIFLIFLADVFLHFQKCNRTINEINGCVQSPTLTKKNIVALCRTFSECTQMYVNVSVHTTMYNIRRHHVQQSTRDPKWPSGFDAWLPSVSSKVRIISYYDRQ